MGSASDHVQVPLPPPFVFAGHLLAALVLQWVVPLGIPWRVDSRIAGGLIVVLGLWLGFAAVRRMLQAHTSPDPNRPATTLVTTGPYGRTRNPIYLGFFLIYLGITFLAGTLWGLLLSPFLLRTVDHAIIRAEEKYLEDRFEGAYTTYSAHVRKWL